MNIDKLKTEALRLSPEARAYLARELLSSLDTLNEADSKGCSVTCEQPFGLDEKALSDRGFHILPV